MQNPACHRGKKRKRAVGNSRGRKGENSVGVKFREGFLSGHLQSAWPIFYLAVPRGEIATFPEIGDHGSRGHIAFARHALRARRHFPTKQFVA